MLVCYVIHMDKETVLIRVRKSTRKRLKVKAARAGKSIIDLVDDLSNV